MSPFSVLWSMPYHRYGSNQPSYGPAKYIVIVGVLSALGSLAALLSIPVMTFFFYLMGWS
jgi:hypothetical protein